MNIVTTLKFHIRLDATEQFESWIWVGSANRVQRRLLVVTISFTHDEWFNQKKVAIRGPGVSERDGSPLAINRSGTRLVRDLPRHLVDDIEIMIAKEMRKHALG